MFSYNKMDNKALILEALEKVRKQEVANKESWKARAYAVAIKELKSFDKPIQSADDVKDVKGVGKSILAKIEEIIETGKLDRLKDYNADGHAKIVDDLLRVHGIGPSKANELVKEHGIKGVEDLENHKELLNEKQLIGLKYYKDFELRIPRAEMVKHENFLKAVIEAIDPKLVVEVVGSYRRNSKDSGDIDILVAHKDDPKDHDHFIKDIVENLKNVGYLVNDFALGSKKYLGICRLKRHKHFRRIDILYTPSHEFPFAQLYFTGDQQFNIEMRNIALSKNLSLSEYGLKYVSGKNKNKFVDAPFKSEEDVFKYLGYNYVPPDKRKGGALQGYAILNA